MPPCQFCKQLTPPYWYWWCCMCSKGGMFICRACLNEKKYIIHYKICRFTFRKQYISSYDICNECFNSKLEFCYMCLFPLIENKECQYCKHDVNSYFKLLPKDIIRVICKNRFEIIRSNYNK